MKQTAKETGIEGRIINLSSIAHLYTYEEGIRFDNINEEDGYAILWVMKSQCIKSHSLLHCFCIHCHK